MISIKKNILLDDSTDYNRIQNLSMLQNTTQNHKIELLETFFENLNKNEEISNFENLTSILSKDNYSKDQKLQNSKKHHKVKVVKLITIEEEEFELEIIDNQYFINHPKWSLSGEGKSILEAENNLILEAKEIYQILVKSSVIDPQTSEMLNFIAKII